MSEIWSKRVNDMTSWVKENATDSEGRIDTGAVMIRVREAVVRVDHEVDAGAIVARVKETVANAEGATATEKVKKWVDDADSETLRGWVAEAKRRAESLRGGDAR